MKTLFFSIIRKIIKSIVRLNTRPLLHKGVAVADVWPTLERGLNLNADHHVTFDISNRDVWFVLHHQVVDSDSYHSIDASLTPNANVVLGQMKLFFEGFDLPCEVKEKKGRPYLVFRPNAKINERRLIELLLIPFFKCSPDEIIDLYYIS